MTGSAPRFDPQSPTVPMLLQAYRQGFFPMADPCSGRVEWYSPDPRAILPIDGLHVPRNVARQVRRGRVSVRCDTAFEAVMRACAAPRRSDPLTWIDDRLIRAYVALFESGHAHSIEAWLEGSLVGGLYGVHIAGAFFGESMFVRPEQGGSQSSKVCLVHLVRWLRSRGFTLLDTQFRNPHLDQFGCVEIPREEYLRCLQAALDAPVSWDSFAVDPP